MYSQISAATRKIRKVPFILWLWVAQFFLLVNAPIIAKPEQVDMFRTTLIIYMIGQVLFFKLGSKVPGLNMNMNMALPWFAGGFIGTVLVITGIQAIREVTIAGLQTQMYSLSAAVYFIVLHALVVGVAEELMFRGFLVQIFTVVPAQIFFGLFHASAYGGDLFSIIVAVGAGFIFYTAMKFSGNIWLACGIHAGYNIGVLRVFGVL